MKLVNFEDYKNYYEKYHRLLCNSYVNFKKKLNNNQLKSKYEKYVKKSEKSYKEKSLKLKKYVDDKKEELLKVIEENGFEKYNDKKWDDLLEKVKIRDDNRCQLIKVLSEEEKKVLYEKVPEHLLAKLEGAHIIRRSCSKKLYYCIENIRLVNRWSHRNLDEFRSPITGDFITKEEVSQWWVRICGSDVHSWLQENK